MPSRHASSLAADRETHSSPTRRPTVWVVDDSPGQADFYGNALAQHYDVSVFHDGAVVLESFASRPLPDVLVLDWLMPAVSGLEVCRFVRGTLHLNLAELPIIVVTAATPSEDQVAEALSAGANDFVHKPVSPIELNARVAGLARLSSVHTSLSAAEHQLRIEAEFRERFMGMLAHDLRQPLQTISLACAMQMNGDTPASRGIGRALRAAERMKRMVTELVDFTRNRPDSGMPVQRRSTDLEAVARAIIDELRPAYPSHELDLRVSGICRGQWDPDRLAQVLTNLVTNAVEHGAPNCKVDICLRNDGDAVELRVSNQGPSIPPEALATVFQPFRMGRSGARPGGGVGLGLHIVHQIATAHGGTVAARSEDAETHFVVRLPIDPPPLSGLATTKPAEPGV